MTALFCAQRQNITANFRLACFGMCAHSYARSLSCPSAVDGVLTKTEQAPISAIILTKNTTEADQRAIANRSGVFRPRRLPHTGGKTDESEYDA